MKRDVLWLLRPFAVLVVIFAIIWLLGLLVH